MPDRFRGRPSIDASKCRWLQLHYVESCPTGAVYSKAATTIDIGRCLFCADCTTTAIPRGRDRFPANTASQAASARGSCVTGREEELADALSEKAPRPLRQIL